MEQEAIDALIATHAAALLGDWGADVVKIERPMRNGAGGDDTRLLAPCDLQAVKACGVTFAGSMVERVIEERARGNPDSAQAIRAEVTDPARGTVRLSGVTITADGKPLRIETLLPMTHRLSA